MKILLLFLFGLFAAISGASPAAASPLQDILRLVENHQGSWIAFKAHITFQTTAPAGRPASCGGGIAYEKLDERMMLLCVGSQKNLLFAFKSEDKNFEFYQPEAGTLYYGTIFDLEDAVNLSSGIQPLHLYRALKLSAIPEKKALVESRLPEQAVLAVKNQTRKIPYVKRTLWITQDGQVPREIYYFPDGKKEVTILKSEDQTLRGQGMGKTEQYLFPGKVTLEENGSPRRKTILSFDHFDFTPVLAGQSWALSVASGTRRVNVSGDFEKLEKHQLPAN